MEPGTAIHETLHQRFTEILDAHAAALRTAVAQGLEQAVPPILAALGEDILERLKAATTSLQEGTTQSEVLRALLEGAAMLSRRAALFLVQGETAIGWEAHGFSEDPSIKQVALDLRSGLAARALQQRLRVQGPVTQLGARVVQMLGGAEARECHLVPLVIREKVSVLIYADGGSPPDSRVEVAALELLVRSAAMWIELMALRKLARTQAPPLAASAQSLREPPAAPAPAPLPSSPGTVTGVRSASSTAYAEPGMPAAQAVQTATLPSQPIQTAVPQALASVPAVASQPAVPAASAIPGDGNADEELHRKARRFAKLLVDEIKLYNQSKLTDGKRNSDLYTRLKDDIEKSRTTYDNRYAQTAVASAGYFTQELIRNLADNNPVLLGSDFPR
jgi:hypothetical protein